MASITHDNVETKVSAESRSAWPPQFALRTLLVGVALLAATLALLSQVGPYAALVLVFAGILVAAHVAGNVIGTNLREQSPTRRTIAPDTPRSESPETVRVDMRPSQLVDHMPIDRRVVTAMVTAGLLAAVLMTLVTIPIWTRVGIVGIAIMVVSGGLIGSFFGFMAVRLFMALRGAFRPGASRDRDAD